MTEQERMLSGALYNAGDPALLEARQRAKCLCHRFNTQSPEDDAYAQHQQETLQALLGHVGTQCWIEAPFHCDYGTQITIGDHFFANYDCIFLDVAPIVIGNHVFLGPRVSLYTAGHPLTAQIRNLELEFGKPITIGDSVWIGGDTTVLPGVTIGPETVVAAGSVVTKDLPSGVIAAGNPCRVLRPLSEEDRAFWLAQREAYLQGST